MKEQIEKLLRHKGWDKFKDDILLYGCTVTDKEGNRVDPTKVLTP